ncbi:hypothetical protein HYPSUDRAFT_209504 [Hypholoma sublateritium FD-334 SS-4]|uniref:Uncharacterized protein n=1 Tax=Hypholoma sublateritium (strain FD-334 SS-4) TaxID=945553 RepID=A0A0D2N2J5_HYPSF|nr:hypothetical protein HYPSUDRAFT_209504 [Hypholoma sublateritium FD-334 SS-4]
MPVSMLLKHGSAHTRMWHGETGWWDICAGTLVLVWLGYSEDDGGISAQYTHAARPVFAPCSRRGTRADSYRRGATYRACVAPRPVVSVARAGALALRALSNDPPLEENGMTTHSCFPSRRRSRLDLLLAWSSRSASAPPQAQAPL